MASETSAAETATDETAAAGPDGISAPEPVVLWSRQPEDRAGTPLLVLLHGYGSDEQDLMGLVPELPPEFSCASVRAPVPMDPQVAPGGFTWFPLDPQRLAYRSDQAREAVESLWSWIASVKEQHSSVTLLGFSMGMAMATSLLRSRPDQFAAVVGLSGFAVDPAGSPEVEEYFDDEALAERQVPLFWGRDQEDPIIPQEYVDYTHAWANRTVKLTKVLYAGAGHGVVPQEISHVREFLNHTVLR